MSEMMGISPEWLKAELARPGRSQSALARFLGVSSAAIVNRMAQGTRDISAKEADQIRAYLKATAGNRDPDEAKPPTIANTPDLPEVDSSKDYVAVEVLPTFAGMGGGGTGEGDAATALVSRALIERELRGRPEDFLIIDVRGDSMLDPQTGKGFAHGDQLMVDRRDRNPRQPGAFALWYDDGYVVKNLEILRAEGKMRIFSNNPAYSDEKVDPEEVNIMGRPVWYARRL